MDNSLWDGLGLLRAANYMKRKDGLSINQVSVLLFIYRSLGGFKSFRCIDVSYAHPKHEAMRYYLLSFVRLGLMEKKGRVYTFSDSGQRYISKLLQIADEMVRDGSYFTWRR